MNRDHLESLSSDGWASFLASDLIPWVLSDDLDLGSDVLEVGPGPGRTTDILATRAARLTAVEIDAQLASDLARRFTGSHVSVLHADAAAMPFDDASFSGACCFVMLHHVPTPEHQQQLLREVRRVLRPGAAFAGADATHSDDLKSRHRDDTYNPVAPSTLRSQLERAGFVSVSVDERPGLLRFGARVPA